jgi:hypothetical protein
LAHGLLLNQKHVAPLVDVVVDHGSLQLTSRPLVAPPSDPVQAWAALLSPNLCDQLDFRAYSHADTPVCHAGFSPQTAKRWAGFCHKPRNQKPLRRNSPETEVR